MSETKTNENRVKSAALRMALKLIPDDLLQKAPEHLENFLKGQLAKIDLNLTEGEAGSCFIIIPGDDRLDILAVTMDEKNTVQRIVDRTNLTTIFNTILENMKEL